MIDGCLHACMPVLSGVLRKCMKSASYLNPACRVFLPPPRRPGNATQSGRYFTHFLPQKYAPLSIVYWFTTVHHDLAFFNIQQLPKTARVQEKRKETLARARPLANAQVDVVGPWWHNQTHLGLSANERFRGVNGEVSNSLTI